ncbi:MAG: WD40 repeat domain-containing protein [Thermoguttaceae bacterium]
MFDPRSTKLIRCEICKFEYRYEQSRRQTSTCCPACGNVNIISISKNVSGAAAENCGSEGVLGKLQTQHCKKTKCQKYFAGKGCSLQFDSDISETTIELPSVLSSETINSIVSKRVKSKTTNARSYILAGTVLVQCVICLMAILFLGNAAIRGIPHWAYSGETHSNWSCSKNSSPSKEEILETKSQNKADSDSSSSIIIGTPSAVSKETPAVKIAETSSTKSDSSSKNGEPSPNTQDFLTSFLPNPPIVRTSPLPAIASEHAKSYQNQQSKTTPENTDLPKRIAANDTQNEVVNLPDTKISACDEIENVTKLVGSSQQINSDKKRDVVTKLIDELTSQTTFRLTSAEAILDEAKSLITSNPELCLQELLHAFSVYEEINEEPPQSFYWYLSRVYASLNWGEMLFDNSLPVESLEISRNSRWLLTQTKDNTIWVWDLLQNTDAQDEMNRVGFRLDRGESPFLNVVFTPDYRFVIAGQTNGRIQIWDMTLKNPADSAMTLLDVVAGLQELKISPDGRWLAAFGKMNESEVIAASQQFLRPLPISPIQNCTELVSYTNPHGNLAPVDLRNNAAKMHNESLRIPQKTNFDPFSKTVKAEKISDETNSIPENAVCLWDLQQLELGYIPQPIFISGHRESILSMQFSPDSRWFATGSQDATARVYELDQMSESPNAIVLRGHQLGVIALAFDPNGNWIATGSCDNSVRVWSLRESRISPDSVALTGHLGWISSLAVDSSGKRLFSGSFDSTIRVWTFYNDNIDSVSETIPQIITGEQGAIQQILLSEDGKKLCSIGSDFSLCIRNIDGLPHEQYSVLFRNRNLPIKRIAITPNSQWLLFSYTNKQNPENSGVRLWPLSLVDLKNMATP